MTEELIGNLIDINKEKFKHLNYILELTKTQKNIVNSEDMAKNDEILDKKDEIIKKIDRIDLDFLVKFSEIKKKHNIDNINDLNPKDYPELKELKEITKEISSTLMAISFLDEENNKNLKKGLEKIKLDLKTLKKGRKAYKGYNNTVEASIFIDEKK